MSPTVLNPSPSPRGPLRAERQRGSFEPADMASMETNSDRPEIQSIIREAIRRGTIRVIPVRDRPDHIKIVPGDPGQRSRSSASDV